MPITETFNWHQKIRKAKTAIRDTLCLPNTVIMFTKCLSLPQKLIGLDNKVSGEIIGGHPQLMADDVPQ